MQQLSVHADVAQESQNRQQYTIHSNYGKSMLNPIKTNDHKCRRGDRSPHLQSNDIHDILQLSNYTFLRQENYKMRLCYVVLFSLMVL